MEQHDSLKLRSRGRIPSLDLEPPIGPRGGWYDGFRSRTTKEETRSGCGSFPLGRPSPLYKSRAVGPLFSLGEGDLSI